jgi:hypothetical protein
MLTSNLTIPLFLSPMTLLHLETKKTNFNYKVQYPFVISNAFSLHGFHKSPMDTYFTLELLPIKILNVCLREKSKERERESACEFE